MTSKIDSNLFWLECANGMRVPICGHVSIGRSRTNTISVNSEKASRRHALVHQDEEANCFIIDLGSSNGTFVNGSRISHLAPIKTGDTIEIGTERFLLRAETDPGAPQAAGELADAQMNPCWILISGKEEPADEESLPNADDDTYKTIINWSQVCDQVLARNKAAIASSTNGIVIGYWEDASHDPAIAAQVVKALRELKMVQARQRMEFVLSLHFGTVVMGNADLRRRKSLIGTEASFALQMQSLAWSLRVGSLISEEANRRLAGLLQTRPADSKAVPSERPLFIF